MSIRLAMLSVAAVMVAGAWTAAPVHAQSAGEAHGGTGPHLYDPEKSADRSEVLDRLFAQLRQAEDDEVAKVVEQAIIALWLRSGSPTADVLMQQAGRAMNEKNYTAALAILNTVVAQYPEFAEGWNRRATVHFLQGDYDQSIADIERVLDLEPRHFGALSGLGAIHKAQGRGRAALRALRRAHSIYPRLENLDERIRELEQAFDQKI